MELKFWLRRKPDGIVKDNSPRQIYINLNPSSSISSSRKLSSPHAPEPIVEPASHDRTSTTSSAFTGHHHQLQKTDSTSLLLLNSSSQANLLSNSSSNNPDTSSSNLNGQRRPSSVDNINNNRRFSTTPNPHREFTKNYNTNEVSTSKYTIWTFLPKNLYEQFRSVANFYFLFIAILQAFPTFEEVSFGLVIVPIVIILGFTGVKDAVEDWSRHAADRRVNDAVCYLLRYLINFLPFHIYDELTSSLISCKIKSMRSSNSNNGILVILIDFVSSFSSSLLHFFKSILSIVKGGQPKPRATRRYDPDHLEPSHYLDFSEIASLPNERLEMKDKGKQTGPPPLFFLLCFIIQLSFFGRKMESIMVQIAVEECENGRRYPY